MAERIGIYPGSFDPPTRGHEDIARRALAFVDRLIVAVAHHPTQEKSRLFPIRDRLELLRECFAGESRITVEEFEGLLVEFAKTRHAQVVVRGLRAVSDFEYEFQMAMMNRRLAPEVETVFMAPAVEHTFLSASLVREVAALGGDLAPFVSAPVLRRLRARTSPA
jgi:pantetheine-phosphate adenylyltransferase